MHPTPLGKGQIGIQRSRQVLLVPAYQTRCTLLGPPWAYFRALLVDSYTEAVTIWAWHIRDSAQHTHCSSDVDS